MGIHPERQTSEPQIHHGFSEVHLSLGKEEKMPATQPMTVGNPTFLVDRLGLDCAPLQFVRELNQNALEAIERRREAGWSGEGRVIWDVDWTLAENYGVFKLQVSDNGAGMTGPQVEMYINSLSSSGSEQGFAKNFGVGAKISAGKENPHGLVYKSWVNGDGVLATFWRDPIIGYGLKQYEVGGRFGHFAPIDASLRSNPIDECGTSVTLMGNDDDENTYWKPGLKQKWLIQYLNSRYFELPSDVVIKVRDFSQADPTNWPTSPDVGMGPGGSQMRTIEGMKHYLTKYSESSGSLPLENATAHWWLLPDGLNVSGGVWDDKSHIAALFQSELYDVKRRAEARSELISFGIIYGQSRVVLYIEPNTSVLNVVANTARSNLLVVNGETSVQLPWADWAAEFRNNIPEPIRQMMDEILSQADAGNYADEVKRRLKEIRDLLRISRYRRTSRGRDRVEGDLPGGSTRDTGDTRGPRNQPGSKPRTGGANSDLYSSFISDTGEPGEEVRNRDNIPEVRWVSVGDGTRVEGLLEDKAARYVIEQNLILANADFRGFQRLMEVLSADYPHADPASIKQTVQAWSTLQLIEAVLGIQSLQGSPEWSSTEDVQRALSEEALTTAVMVRYASLSQMKRQLGSRVGRSEQN